MPDDAKSRTVEQGREMARIRQQDREAVKAMMDGGVEALAGSSDRAEKMFFNALKDKEPAAVGPWVPVWLGKWK